MHILALVLYWGLNVFFYAFLARFVLDLMLSINPRLRPRGVLLVLSEIVMTLTDAPLKVLRKVIKPVRLGPVQLDFAWTVGIFIISLLSSLVLRLG
jgi:YggT family protein